MARDANRYAPKPQGDHETHPFSCAEEAWFWFVQAQQARQDGARVIAGQALLMRPCEPLDIIKIIDTLYRQRRLLIDHMLVLRHYGRRMLPPDPRRIKEARAHALWHEALDRMEDVFVRRGIVSRSTAIQSPQKISVSKYKHI